MDNKRIDFVVSRETPFSVPVKEFYSRIGFKETTAWKLIRLGKVDSVRVGRRTFVTVESIERFLQSGMTIGKR